MGGLFKETEEEEDLENRNSVKKNVWESDEEGSDDDDEKAGKGVKWGDDVV